MSRTHLIRLAVVVAVGALPSTAPAGPDAQPFPPYVIANAAWTVLSNAQWAVEGGGKARQLAEISTGLGAAPSEKASLVWARTCKRDVQTVVFKRTIEVPGIPSQLTFALVPFSVQSVRVVVNGKRALDVDARKLQSGSTVSFQLDAADRRFFHLGPNALRVVVRKGALPASAPACNGSRTLDAASRGVSFGFQAQTAADLSVKSASYKPVKSVRGTTITLNGAFAVENRGPSAALPGEFGFTGQLGFLTGVVHAVNAGPPFGSCTTKLGPPLSVTCPFSVFPAGARATVSLQVVARVASGTPPTEVNSMSFGWGVHSVNRKLAYYSTPDPDPSDNAQTQTVHLCGPQAVDPRCPK